MHRRCSSSWLQRLTITRCVQCSSIGVSVTICVCVFAVKIFCVFLSVSICLPASKLSMCLCLIKFLISVPSSIHLSIYLYLPLYLLVSLFFVSVCLSVSKLSMCLCMVKFLIFVNSSIRWSIYLSAYLSVIQSLCAYVLVYPMIPLSLSHQVAYSEDCSKEIERDQVLHGLKACAKDDVIHRRWLSECLVHTSSYLLMGVVWVSFISCVTGSWIRLILALTFILLPPFSYILVHVTLRQWGATDRL